jgi:hypothetical protein
MAKKIILLKFKINYDIISSQKKPPLIIQSEFPIFTL